MSQHLTADMVPLFAFLHTGFLSSSLLQGNTEACKQHSNSVVIMLDVSVASVGPHRHVFVAVKPPCERTVSFIRI